MKKAIKSDWEKMEPNCIECKKYFGHPEKDNKCSRTVCSHYELDAREYMSQSDRPLPYAPRGAVDGCVVDTTLCKNMSFLGRWGSSCGTPFLVKDFMNKNIQWKRYEPYLHDRVSQPWTLFKIGDKMKKYTRARVTKSITNKSRKK